MSCYYTLTQRHNFATLYFMQIIINLLVNGLAVFITAQLLPGVSINNFTTAIIVGVVLGIINTLIKPVLLILTLPLNIMTLGLFTFILNGLLILLTSMLITGFSVKNFWWAFLFSIVISLVNSVLHSFTKR